ncbi:MAG: helix-turn-helix transcriptional regulator [Marmoricola sp.]
MLSPDLQGGSGIVSELGSPGFGPASDEFLRGRAPFDMTCIFAFHPTSPALLIHDGYSAGVSRTALSSYLKGGYLLDPFYVACTSDVADGLWRMSEIAPDEFFASDFAASNEVHPCISDESGTLVEEIGYIVTLADHWRATYSLMRSTTSSPYSTEEFEALSELAPLVSGLVQRHSELTSIISDQARGAEVESMLEKAFSPQLTPAQFRVINLILRGHSNQSVARELHITEGTAKLHRHNAYQRLGVTSQSELFRLFIEFLE